MMTSKQDEQKTKSFFWQSNNQSGGFFKGGNDKNSKQIRTNGYSDSILDLDNEDIKKWMQQNLMNLWKSVKITD